MLLGTVYAVFVHFTICTIKHNPPNIIKCCMETLVFYFYGASNGNENEFQVIWFWKCFGNILEIFLKEILRTLISFCNNVCCSSSDGVSCSVGAGAGDYHGGVSDIGDGDDCADGFGCGDSRNCDDYIY